MSTAKIDPSLAEVRKWREALQKELSTLDPTAELEEIHRRAQKLMRERGVELKVEHPRAREKLAS